MPEELRVGSLFSGIPSAASTTDCTGLGFDTSSSVKRILGDGTCLPHGGPECPSTTTYVSSGAGWWDRSEQAMTLASRDWRDGTTLISSAAASPARTSPSPDAVEGSPGNGPVCSSSSPGLSTLFDPDGYSSRTYPGCSPQTAVGTSESSLERWPTSGTAWAGGFSTHVSSECPGLGTGGPDDNDGQANRVIATGLVKRYGKGTDSDATDTLIASTLKSQRGKGGGAEVLETPIARQLTGGGGKPGQGYPAVREGMGVRRLTPVECERLQGLPDDWTKIDSKTPDSRRYSALGDAVTANVGEWIGCRLLAAGDGQP